jgi:methionyl-tRNA formyltransferase
VRVAFLGTPAPAVPALEALVAASDVEIAAVITNPDRPSGRGHKLQPPPVKVAALAAGLDVWQPTRPREVLDELRALEVDACGVVAYGSLLPRDVLDAGGRGFVNLHFSLLPAWRGAAPVQHSIRAGDQETGVTCFVLEEGMDTGPVLTMARTRIAPEETAGELMTRLADLGAPLLVQALRGLVDGTITPEPQDHDRATLAPKISPEDARIDWALDAAEVDRMVRAYNPVPGAHTTFRDQRLKVHRVRPVAGGGAPGRVVAVADGGPVVGCGAGAVELLEVQPAGKPRMAGPDFANGYRPADAVLGA